MHVCIMYMYMIHVHVSLAASQEDCSLFFVVVVSMGVPLCVQPASLTSCRAIKVQYTVESLPS